MELTRRDALVAAAGGGLGVSGGALFAAARSDSESGDGGAAAGRTRESSGTTADTRGALESTFVAVAQAIYPSGVSEVESFVRTYVAERFAGRSKGDSRTDRDAVRATVRDLNGLARGWHGASIDALDPGAVRAVLRDVGVDAAAPDPGGTVSQRVRYHVVNELFYALFASPTGGKLVGIENPVGYPGGIESYRQGSST